MSACVRCGAGTRDTQARPMCRRCACSEPKPAPRPNPPCFCCGVGVEPGPCDDGFTDGERVACGHCGATNYPTVADDGTVEMSDGAEDEGDEPKPAPAVAAVAAEGRYACWQGCCMWLTPEDDDPRDTGTRAEAEAVVARIPGAKLMRVLEDSAHEAAIAAAREEGRREGRELAFGEVTEFAAMMRKEYTEHPGEKVWATAVLAALSAFDRFIGERRKAHDAAKGAAK